MKELNTIEEAESFFLKHGENIVDLIGSEVDRIEKQLKVDFLGATCYVGADFDWLPFD